jgi:hypothetical protein
MIHLTSWGLNPYVNRPVSAANPLRQTAFGMTPKKPKPTPDELKATPPNEALEKAYDTFRQEHPYTNKLPRIAMALSQRFDGTVATELSKRLKAYHEAQTPPKQRILGVAKQERYDKYGQEVLELLQQGKSVKSIVGILSQRGARLTASHIAAIKGTLIDEGLFMSNKQAEHDTPTLRTRKSSPGWDDYKPSMPHD